MLSDGDQEADCLAILDVLYSKHAPLGSPGGRASRWDFLWADLQTRSRGLANRLSILGAGLRSQMPTEYRPADWPASMAEEATGSAKIAADIILVCILEVEYNATLAALDIAQTESDELTFFGHPFVRKVIDTRHCGALNIWVTLVGRPRNLVCTHFCRDMFERFDVQFCCILVGIAAGHPEQLKFGDVVGAKMILDIEGGRVEPGGEKPRPVPYSLKAPLSETFEAFTPRRWNWLKSWESCVAILRQTNARIPDNWNLHEPEFRPGIIVAGEKLRRDDPLPKLSKRYGDGVLALDMEGSGFASACDKKGTSWLVFRGITDHGNMRKRDEWHSIAALNAALAARSFIVNWLRPTRGSDEIP